MYKIIEKNLTDADIKIGAILVPKPGFVNINVYRITEISKPRVVLQSWPDKISFFNGDTPRIDSGHYDSMRDNHYLLVCYSQNRLLS